MSLPVRKLSGSSQGIKTCISAVVLRDWVLGNFWNSHTRCTDLKICALLMRMYEYIMHLRKSAAVEIVLKSVIFQCDLVF